jgi:intraflagellar transport protein 46
MEESQDESETEESSSDSEDDDASGAQLNVEGAYNPADYANLDVGGDIREIFDYISRYKPHEVELDTSLKCFIPDYIPAVGEMDAFIKIPQPSGNQDDLGLKVLDEPAATQSDATVLELQL